MPELSAHVLSAAYYINALTPEECQAIIGCEGEFEDSKVLRHDQSLGVDKDIRVTLMKALPLSEKYNWLYKKLELYFQRANQELFHFELSGLKDTQVLKYPIGGNYNWHTDLGPGPASIRKLSLIAFLSPYSDYEGGRLRLKNDSEFSQAQGSLVIFPSYLMHRVEPVIRGMRYSLVSWACGPVFR